MIKAPFFRIQQDDAFTDNSEIEFLVTQEGYGWFAVHIDVNIPGLGAVSTVNEAPDYGTALDLALTDIFRLLNNMTAPEYDAAKEYRDRMKDIAERNPNWRSY